ncbi:importin-4-like isoform X4 [Athene noctua]|uniref:importin-4-like isoform X4 n=1 Tax=Athene noctua TaxID=126797 RepID=UPI003EBA3210
MAAPDLERLLEALLEPDSGAIRRATAGLREAFADPQTPARLGLLLRAAPRPQVRQLAAVLLRRRLLGRWRRLDPALRQRLPALLAEALERETEHTVTVALAQLGALVLRRGGLGAWGPLGTWAQAAARDPQPGRQEELLRSLLPDILAALKGLLDTDEDRGAEALEVLDEFLEADPGAVTPHLRPLLDLCLQVGGDESRGDPVRVRALATVTFLAQKCPKALLRGGLLGPILGGLLTPLCADPPPGRPDPEEEEEEEGAGQGGAEGRAGPSPRHAAAQALDALAMGLPPEKLLQHLVPLLEPPLRSPRAGARTWARRWGRCGGGWGTPNPACGGRPPAPCGAWPTACSRRWRGWRGGAAGGAGGSGGVPAAPPQGLVRPGESARVSGGGGGAVAPPVLEAILGALEPAGPPRNVELGLSALHSLASTAGEQLQPHAGPILGALTPLLQPGPPETRPRRLQALGVLGALGRPVAGEGLVPALEVALGLAGEEEEEEEAEGRRVMFVLAGAVAEALGEGMGPLLPRVVPVLLGTLRRPPPAAPPEAPDSFLLFDDEDEDEDEEPMEEEEEEDEEEELIEVEVSVAFAREVEDACEALGEVAEHSRAAFLPFLEPSLEAVMGLVEFPQSGVRGAAYETLGSLCLALGGAPAPPDGTAPPLERVLEALLGAIRGDPAPGGGPGGAGGVGADPGGARPRPPARSAGSHWAAAG